MTVGAGSARISSESTLVSRTITGEVSRARRLVPPVDLQLDPAACGEASEQCLTEAGRGSVRDRLAEDRSDLRLHGPAVARRAHTEPLSHALIQIANAHRCHSASNASTQNSRAPTVLASWSSSQRLACSPPAYPVRSPSAPITRWHGVTIAIGLLPLAMPTAREATRGSAPTRAAISPYDVVVP